MAAPTRSRTAHPMGAIDLPDLGLPDLTDDGIEAAPADSKCRPSPRT
ncbi:hypothetical protein [Streptomyces jumonjinensis]